MALKPKLMADGATGKVAIFMVDENTPTDRTLLDNPTSNLSRVLFHSDLHYPVIVSKHTGTLSLPSRPSDDYGRASHALFAHGAGGWPFVIGRIKNLGGVDVALAGSVPIQTSIYGTGRWLHLGADNTNVILYELWHTHTTMGVSSTSIDWEVWLTDLILES